MAGHDGATDMLNIQHGPKVINLNTYVTIAGFLIMISGSIFAWGTIFAGIRDGLDLQKDQILLVDKRVAALEVTTRVLDNHELRLANLEQQAAGSATAMRAVETSIGQLSSDIRVVREILQRLEQRQPQQTYQ